jgi:uncharacterized protein (TIGR03086 family)
VEFDEIRDLDKRAVQASVTVVSHARADDLARATPCAGWDLADLLAHMTTQHYGFAAAAEGRGADPDVWRTRTAGDDPVQDYTKSADVVVAAFADDAVADRQLSLPEISTEVTFPASQAISFHFIDYVVHGWDVARTLGIPLVLDADVLEAGLAVAAKVPGGDRRLAPGAAFAPSVPALDDGEPIDLIVAMLGRSPTWQR